MKPASTTPTKQKLGERVSMADANSDARLLTHGQCHILDELLPMVSKSLGPLQFLMRLNYDQVITIRRPLSGQKDMRCDHCSAADTMYCMLTLKDCLRCEAQHVKCTFSKGERETWPKCRHKTWLDRYPIPRQFKIDNPETKNLYKHLDQMGLAGTLYMERSMGWDSVAQFSKTDDAAALNAQQLDPGRDVADKTKERKTPSGEFAIPGFLKRETTSISTEAAVNDTKKAIEKLKEATEIFSETTEVLCTKLDEIQLQESEISSLKRELNDKQSQHTRLLNSIARIQDGMEY